jgi:hypothetical protein
LLGTSAEMDWMQESNLKCTSHMFKARSVV